MQMASGSNLLFLWSSATFLMPVLGAVAADSFAGRFRMICFGSVVMLVVNPHFLKLLLCCISFDQLLYMIVVKLLY